MRITTSLSCAKKENNWRQNLFYIKVEIISQNSKKRPQGLFFYTQITYQYQLYKAFYCQKLIEHYKIALIKKDFCLDITSQPSFIISNQIFKMQPPPLYFCICFLNQILIHVDFSLQLNWQCALNESTIQFHSCFGLKTKLQKLICRAANQTFDYFAKNVKIFCKNFILDGGRVVFNKNFIGGGDP